MLDLCVCGGGVHNMHDIQDILVTGCDYWKYKKSCFSNYFETSFIFCGSFWFQPCLSPLGLPYFGMYFAFLTPVIMQNEIRHTEQI